MNLAKIHNLTDFTFQFDCIHLSIYRIHQSLPWYLSCPRNFVVIYKAFSTVLSSRCFYYMTNSSESSNNDEWLWLFPFKDVCYLLFLKLAANLSFLSTTWCNTSNIEPKVHYTFDANFNFFYHLQIRQYESVNSFSRRYCSCKCRIILWIGPWRMEIIQGKHFFFLQNLFTWHYKWTIISPGWRMGI